MLSKYSAESLQQQLAMISEHGFCVMDDFIDPITISALANEVRELRLLSKLHAATTGRTQSTIKTSTINTSAIKTITVDKPLRGDSIYWLDESTATAAQQAYFLKMEALRIALNQQLYLGLYALECHLAVYPIGTFYKKHLDRFNSQPSLQPQRQISSILYLNQQWRLEDAGQLRLYLNTDNPASLALAADHLDINPIGGRLLLFLSDVFYHEVLPTNKERASLTGWFLTR